MADNRRYYWLKLKEDFFTDKRIKRLRKISGGDTYTIIYLKLLLLSLKDSGKLYYDGVETDFIKELALTIDETEDDVMVTVNYIVAQGLMEIITENDEYFLTEIPSLIGSETASTRRSRKHFYILRKRRGIFFLFLTLYISLSISISPLQFC